MSTETRQKVAEYAHVAGGALLERFTAYVKARDENNEEAGRAAYDGLHGLATALVDEAPIDGVALPLEALSAEAVPTPAPEPVKAKELGDYSEEELAEAYRAKTQGTLVADKKVDGKGEAVDLTKVPYEALTKEVARRGPSTGKRADKLDLVAAGTPAITAGAQTGMGVVPGAAHSAAFHGTVGKVNTSNGKLDHTPGVAD